MAKSGRDQEEEFVARGEQVAAVACGEPQRSSRLTRRTLPNDIREREQERKRRSERGVRKRERERRREKERERERSSLLLLLLRDRSKLT